MARANFYIFFKLVGLEFGIKSNIRYEFPGGNTLQCAGNGLNCGLLIVVLNLWCNQCMFEMGLGESVENKQ